MEREREGDGAPTVATVGLGLLTAVALPVVHWALSAAAAPRSEAPVNGWVFVVELVIGLGVVAVATLAGLVRHEGLDAAVRALSPALFEARLADELARGRRVRKPLAVLLLELGREHATGRDREALIGAVSEACRGSDVLGHEGRSQSLAVLAPEADAQGALALAARIRNAISAALGPVSVGVTQVAPDRLRSVEAVVAAANGALDEARHRGGDATVLAPG